MEEYNFIHPKESWPKLMAIDPGSTESAYVIWDGTQIIEKGIIENDLLLKKLAVSRDYDLLAIEMVASYGMAVGKDVFETVFWIGRFYEGSHLRSGAIKRIYRKEVKIHHCGSMRAKDSNIRQALIDKYGKTGTKKNPSLVYNDSENKMAKDIWSAFAIATYLTEI